MRKFRLAALLELAFGSVCMVVRGYAPRPAAGAGLGPCTPGWGFAPGPVNNVFSYRPPGVHALGQPTCLLAVGPANNQNQQSITSSAFYICWKHSRRTLRTRK